MDKTLLKQVCSILTLSMVVRGKEGIENSFMKAGTMVIHNDTNIVGTFVDISIAVCNGLCALRPSCSMAEYKYTTKFCKLLSGNLQIQMKPGFYAMNKDEFSKEPNNGYRAIIRAFRKTYCREHGTRHETKSACRWTECGHPGVCTGCSVHGNMYSIGSKVMYSRKAIVMKCSEMGIWYDIANPIPLTCGEMQSRNYALSSGVYRNKFGVLLSCDLDSDGGRWTVFQRRFNGSVDFYRNWNDYENGFGDLESNGEFWLGLKPLAQILHSSVFPFVLRIDLVAWGGEQGYALYENFNLSSVTDDYRLSVGKYSGNVGDALGDMSSNITYNNYQRFSTHDRDNDRELRGNCAKHYPGGWWFNSCFNAHLNGLYPYDETANKAKAIIWKQWKGYHKSMKESCMKIREMRRLSYDN